MKGKNMSDDSGSSCGCLGTVIIVLIVLGCIGLGLCAMLRCEACNPVPAELIDTEIEETDDLKDTEENRKALEKLEKRLAE